MSEKLTITISKKKIGLMIGIPGLIFMIIGIAFLIESFLFTKTSLTTEGTIVELIETRDSDGDLMYKAIFEFSDEEGLLHRITPNSSSNPPVGYVNEKVEILYNKLNPEKARINKYFNLYGIGTIFIVLGLIFTLIGFGIYFSHKSVLNL